MYMINAHSRTYNTAEVAEYHSKWTIQNIDEYFAEKAAAQANATREATALASSISDEQVMSTETFISKDIKTKMKAHNTVMLDCGSRVHVVGAKTYNDYRGKWEACGLSFQII